MKAFVSAVIPAYNARPFIGDAIRSVLDQPDPVNLIVVDDGSTDGTSDEVASFGNDVHLIRFERNRGLPSALNSGVENARGDVIGFLDADDLWSPGRIGAEVELLSRMPEAPALWGRTRIVFLSGESQVGSSSPEWPPAFFPALGSMLIRRTVFERLGRFDPTLRHAQDFDFLARAKEAGLLFHRHEGIVLTWRRHAGNMTNDVTLDRDYLATALRLALRRRRLAATESVQ
jgi:glycosyltransferase involved in cell wall biosynthesis